MCWKLVNNRTVQLYGKPNNEQAFQWHEKHGQEGWIVAPCGQHQCSHANPAIDGLSVNEKTDQIEHERNHCEYTN